MISGDILQDQILNQNNAVFKQLPPSSVTHQIITKKINPKDYGLELATNKIKKRYNCQRRKKKNIRGINSKVVKWMKKVGYFDTSDLQTIDYKMTLKLQIQKQQTTTAI